MQRSDEGSITYDAFCPDCGEERPVIRTVPWQFDACVECGSDVDGDDAEG